MQATRRTGDSFLPPVGSAGATTDPALESGRAVLAALSKQVSTCSRTGGSTAGDRAAAPDEVCTSQGPCLLLSQLTPFFTRSCAYPAVLASHAWSGWWSASRVERTRVRAVAACPKQQSVATHPGQRKGRPPGRCHPAAAARHRRRWRTRRRFAGAVRDGWWHCQTHGACCHPVRLGDCQAIRIWGGPRGVGDAPEECRHLRRQAIVSGERGRRRGGCSAGRAGEASTKSGARELIQASTKRLRVRLTSRPHRPRRVGTLPRSQPRPGGHQHPLSQAAGQQCRPHALTRHSSSGQCCD